ncbi:MAG TPA: DUF5335 family protein [Terriglobia bacterium]|nr:DUF5335 family protein [Terriglobia bacterium]
MTFLDVSAVTIPHDEWQEFLESFSEQRHHRRVQLETHDIETEETVLSGELLLRSIDLDLEDEKNPRINIVVDSGNKVIKHILFRPSRVVFYPSAPGAVEALQIDSVHTNTKALFL